MNFDNSQFSLDDRVLCSDGACIGVIGSDGRCKECGLEHSGDAPLPSQDSAKEEELDSQAKEESPSQEKSDDAPDPEERICCPDDNCIGIIGPNGTCGTCGKAG